MIFAPCTVNVLSFKINSMDRNAIVSFGPLQQIDYFQSNKRNQAFGEQNGDLALVFSPFDLLFDQDVNDANAVKGPSFL